MPPTVRDVTVPFGVKFWPVTVTTAPASAVDGATVMVGAAITLMDTGLQTKSALRSTAQTMKV